jgi:hypothetical protein
MSLDKLKNKLKGLEAKLDKAIDSENYESAADIREEIEKVKEKIKKAEDKNDLEEQFDEIKEKHSDFTPDVFFPGNELPGLGENVEVYDYEGEFDKLREKAEKVIEIMVLNIFNNDEKVLKDPIIVEKMKDDVDSYTDLKFAVIMSRRLFMNGMKDLDNGAQNSRMYEVVSKMQAEMRHNNKMLTTLMKEFNASYRQLKEDMAERLISEDEKENTNIVDMKSMNDMIQKHLEEKKKKRIEEKRKANRSQARDEDDDLSMSNPDNDNEPEEDNEKSDKEKGDE